MSSDLVRVVNPSPSQRPDETAPWNTAAATECYQIDAWGGDYFSVGREGQVEVTPTGADGPPIGLHDLAVDLRRRGYQLPVLVRFSEILNHRLAALHRAFHTTIKEYGYQGDYRSVFPIKVNQQCDILEEFLPYGRQLSMGLEVGSKPELLVALAYMDETEGVIVCNGFKDQIYVETALLAQQLGRHPILVIDRFPELEMVLEIAKDLDVTPVIGVRVRLSSRGAGRWNESGGSKSKFGLTASEVVRVVERLREVGMLDSLQLLHFHIGSQVVEIRAIKAALREAARFFVGLHRLGAELSYLDVGGGLGVDYDGSRSSSTSSINYSLQEYANDVVAEIQQVCDEAEVPHPNIISESGRAIAAYHSVLIFDVLGANRIENPEPPDESEKDEIACIRALYEAWRDTDEHSFLETYHDALQAREEALHLFSLGYLDLRGRSRAEDLYWAVCLRVRHHMRIADSQPEELEELERSLSDTYFCNFSVFQSAPDSWAIEQLFPVMPIHRLDERPTRLGTLADLTCDSDGRIHRFIDSGGHKHALELHADDGRPYILGMFLVGAYQETLGDLHNLFGDTHAVHVTLDPECGYRIDRVVEGDTVNEVLESVNYTRRDLVRRVRQSSEDAVRRGKLSMEQSARLLQRFEEGLAGYTYLSPKHLRIRESHEAELVRDAGLD